MVWFELANGFVWWGFWVMVRFDFWLLGCFDLSWVLPFVRPLGCLRVCRGCLLAVRFGRIGLLL